jgi:hypothetical protein
MTKACLLALVSLLAACDKLDNCPDEREPIPIEDRHTDRTALVYESAQWGGETLPWPDHQEVQLLDHFPPDTELHFKHGLGVVPTLIKTYLAFSKEGTNGPMGGDVTENAGNQGRIQCVDAEEIVITNDTCEEDFYIRVVAYGLGSTSTEIFCAGTTPDGNGAGGAAAE